MDAEFLRGCSDDPQRFSQLLLGLVAYRVGEPIDYDGKTGKSSNEKANALMGKKYREGWPLNG